MTAKRKGHCGFTLVELLVVTAVIAVLTGLLFPVLNRAREAARRAACMAHMRQIQMAWHLYAIDNRDFIVNGQAESDYLVHNEGTPWLVGGYNSQPHPQNAAQGETLMRTGALAAYVGDVRVYMCPGRYRRVTSYLKDQGMEWLSSYHTAPSMNRFPASDWSRVDSQIRARSAIGRTMLFVRKTSELVNPGPASRMVFTDLGTYGTEAGWSSFLTAFTAPLVDGSTSIYENWFLAVHHADGTCTSFADGHVEHWRWVNPSTVAVGRDRAQRMMFGPDDLPAPKAGGWDCSPDNPDAVKLFTAIWGKWPVK
jgi:prepilin-type N-terminal cleavage/methylation domain-containing protein